MAALATAGGAAAGVATRKRGREVGPSDVSLPVRQRTDVPPDFTPILDLISLVAASQEIRRSEPVEEDKSGIMTGFLYSGPAGVNLRHRSELKENDDNPVWLELKTRFQDICSTVNEFSRGRLVRWGDDLTYAMNHREFKTNPVVTRPLLVRPMSFHKSCSKLNREVYGGLVTNLIDTAAKEIESKRRNEATPEYAWLNAGTPSVMLKPGQVVASSRPELVGKFGDLSLLTTQYADDPSTRIVEDLDLEEFIQRWLLTNYGKQLITGTLEEDLKEFNRQLNAYMTSNTQDALITIDLAKLLSMRDTPEYDAKSRVYIPLRIPLPVRQELNSVHVIRLGSDEFVVFGRIGSQIALTRDEVRQFTTWLYRNGLVDQLIHFATT